ncbi:MAG: hypothetical protein CJD30_09860 [Sulfuricurvum sp. PD_MW2]|uniref:hypothetical protein n=1 Tax=Sulfuricurvum sp. PD_MW2 TaxID=2027917 RepID=UPI000C0670DD|nr:hypothetical protein [Sulfuricurvum sp. PD_MW2]PHM16753.1 MAG: hypothetical protein CJD30_09860 [Sulfuricurvum sp. PD_MW2]
MQPPKQPFYLDVNHAPNFRPFESSSVGLRLRSGDAESLQLLQTLNRSFASAFGYTEAQFCDFTPASLSFFIDQSVPDNEPIAFSSKLPYFLHQAGILLEKSGRSIVWIDADKEGRLRESSLAHAKEQGASYLICALVDEDTFYKESIEKLTQYFDRKHLLLDISNALKLEMIPDVYAAFVWGYKTGSFKHSGVFLSHEKSLNSDMIPYIDLTVYEHFYRSYLNFVSESFKDTKMLRDEFIKRVAEALGSNMTLMINPLSTLSNCCYIRFDGIYARDLIRSLALEGIYLTNGELCSLGLSQPSRILQTMGYSIEEARESISFSFGNVTLEEIEYIANKIVHKYRQLRAILVD